MEKRDPVVENLQPYLIKKFGLEHEVIGETNSRITSPYTSGFAYIRSFTGVRTLEVIASGKEGEVSIAAEPSPPSVKLPGTSMKSFRTPSRVEKAFPDFGERTENFDPEATQKPMGSRRNEVV
jgi:hypothetical protein